MKVYKNKVFDQWAKEIKLHDVALIEAINEMEQGIFDANLGGTIYKKRISIAGRGKRGGLRTIIAYKAEDKAIFIHGYAKNAKDNISFREEQALKKLAKIYFNYGVYEINNAIHGGELIEVHNARNNPRNST